MKFQIFAACLVLAAPAALACPAAEDMAKGIRFTVDGVDKEEYRRSGPGMIEAIYTMEDGTTIRNLLAQGVYLVEYVDLVGGTPDPGTRATYAFPGAASELQVPRAGTSVSYDIAINEMGDIRKERQIYAFGQSSKLNFGACEYEMIPIEVRYEPDSADVVDYLYYLPEFGFAYFAGSDHSEGSDRYMYSNIEVIE